MRHVRLGSYSMAATLAVTPSLTRLKSIDAVALLVAAAAVTGGLASVDVAATGLRLGGAAATSRGGTW